jgi:hypothetical protein
VVGCGESSKQGPGLALRWCVDKSSGEGHEFVVRTRACSAMLRAISTCLLPGGPSTSGRPVRGGHSSGRAEASLPGPGQFPADGGGVGCGEGPGARGGRCCCPMLTTCMCGGSTSERQYRSQRWFHSESGGWQAEPWLSTLNADWGQVFGAVDCRDRPRHLPSSG